MLQRGAILSGKYRIESVLGEGGMAVVYAVTHLRNTARLAVKVLHEGSVLKGHVRARFVREGKVANTVNHPGASRCSTTAWPRTARPTWSWSTCRASRSMP